MSQRTDPMYYEFAIQERKTGEVATARMFCWWSGEASIAGLRAMCDCQLGGFFLAGEKKQFPDWDQVRHGTANNAFTYAQNDWLKQNKCEHKSPSKRYAVLRAVTPDGAVIELGDELKAA